MWALLKSPLILGNDLTNMVCVGITCTFTPSLTNFLFRKTHETFSILTNDAVIAVNQDPLGAAATRSWKQQLSEGELQLWSGPLADG
jgi:alpha-galactosidase